MSMNLSLQVEGVAEVQAALAGMAKGAPKATVRWANWIGLEAQGAMRAELPSHFTMRGTAEQFRKAVAFRSATISGPRQRQAELSVGAPGGGTKASATQRFGQLLARHEDADTRTNSSQVFFDGRGRAMTGLGFFVPAKGQRTATSNPSRKLYPSSIGAALRLTPDSNLILAKGTKKGSKAKGNGESFFATRQGIFRRRHRAFGRADVEAVWWFTKTIRTPARLHLWETAERVFETRAVALGMQAIEETVFRGTL